MQRPDGDCHSLPSILKSLKNYTALNCNRMLGRTGSFWQHESYDHTIRDEAEWRRTVRYVLNNPVSARLVEEWEDWEWSYCSDLSDQ